MSRSGFYFWQIQEIYHFDLRLVLFSTEFRQSTHLSFLWPMHNMHKVPGTRHQAPSLLHLSKSTNKTWWIPTCLITTQLKFLSLFFFSRSPISEVWLFCLKDSRFNCETAILTVLGCQTLSAKIPFQPHFRPDKHISQNKVLSHHPKLPDFSFHQDFSYYLLLPNVFDQCSAPFTHMILLYNVKQLSVVIPVNFILFQLLLLSQWPQYLTKLRVI